MTVWMPIHTGLRDEGAVLLANDADGYGNEMMTSASVRPQPSASVPTTPVACVPAANCENKAVFFSSSSNTDDPTPST